MTETANPNKALWEKGDFTRVAETMRDSGEALVARLGITPGLKVLDVGCGDGTTALPEARLGADVLGVDIAGNLVAAGTRRAEAEGLTNCRFQEGDASHLDDLADDTFDLVVSIFGAMFAPRPFDVAKEMVRVTRPGRTHRHGQLDPRGPDAGRPAPQDLRLLLTASAGGLHQPGDLGSGGERDRAVRAGRHPRRQDQLLARDLRLRIPGPPTELLAVFRDYYGPTMNAFAAAAANDQTEQLQKELDDLFTSQNTSSDPERTSVPATFLQVTVNV